MLLDQLTCKKCHRKIIFPHILNVIQRDSEMEMVSNLNLTYDQVYHKNRIISLMKICVLYVFESFICKLSCAKDCWNISNYRTSRSFP